MWQRAKSASFPKLTWISLRNMKLLVIRTKNKSYFCLEQDLPEKCFFLMPKIWQKMDIDAY